MMNPIIKSVWLEKVDRLNYHVWIKNQQEKIKLSLKNGEKKSKTQKYHWILTEISK